MRTVGFWVFLLLYIASATYVTFEHDDDMDFVISMTMALCSYVGFLVAFFPQKKTKAPETFKKTEKKKQPRKMLATEVFRKKDFDLTITGVMFRKYGQCEECCMNFILADSEGECSVCFNRESYLYIYDQLLLLNGKESIYPLEATVVYDVKGGIYYFKREI